LEKRRTQKSGAKLLFGEEGILDLIDFSDGEKRTWEYNLLGLNVGEHPIAALRPVLKREGIKSNEDIRHISSGKLNSRVSPPPPPSSHPQRPYYSFLFICPFS